MNKLRALCAATALLLGFTSYGAFTPVTVTGFNQDAIANGVGNASASTTAAVDLSDFVLVAPTFQATSASAFPLAALPASGLINSVQTAGLSFQLANYTGNNDLIITAVNGSGTLTLTTPNIGDVYLLGFAGNGAVTATVTLTFTDNTTQVTTGVVFNDWFNATGFAIQGIGRVGRTTNVLENPAGNPRLYEKQITLNAANAGKQIASIGITKTAGGVLSIMAVSINTLCNAPTGLAASGVTATSANMTWNAVTSSAGYEWAITTTSTPPASGTAIATTTHSPGPLLPATTYYYHVRNKCNATTFSAWTTVSFTTAASCPAPATPNITNITQTTATANWAAVAGSQGYEYALTTTSTPPASGTNIGTAVTQGLSPLASGTTYYFHVRNTCTGSLFSAWSTVSFTTQYPPCAAPSTPVVSNINVNGANITWNAVPGATGYQWVVTTSATPPANGTATVNTTEPASGLTGGTLYYVHVRTNCGPGGFSPWSTTTFTTSSSCNVPTNIVITNISATGATIQWDPVPGSVGFEYLVNNAPQAPTTAGAPIATNKYVPANLLSATRYYVHLRTNCGGAAGFSAWVTVQFTTDTLCFAPVAVVNNITGNSADIRWQAEPNAVNYQYYVSTSIVPPFSGYATSAVTYKAKGLAKNTQYYMHLRTYCGGNDISSWRSTGFVTNDKTTGIDDHGAGNSHIDLYPNPAHDKLKLVIKAGSKISGTCILTDITGKIMLQQAVNSTETEININFLPNGIYMLKYSDEQTNATIKVLKI